MTPNPLAKHFRQPKIYLSLPSLGKFYPEGSLIGDPSGLPVFGMTAMDEIMLKTPDGLFSGESVVQVIKSCIPDIVDPWSMPTIDLDSILIAIRIATYGGKMPMTYKCKKCKEENHIDLDLSSTLDYYTSLTYEDYVYLDPLKINLRPLTYKEQTEAAKRQYEYERLLTRSYSDMPEEEKNKTVTEILKQLSELTASTYKKCIDSVEADDTLVDNEEQIAEWIQNSDALFFETVKGQLEKLSKEWRLQDQKSVCGACETENTVNINLDYSSFFVRR